MQKVKKNRTKSLLLAIMIFFGFSACFSKNISKVYAADDYYTWRQLDSRWGNVPMGNSTIARSGCLITSLAIMAMHSNSVDATALKNLNINNVSEFNPGVLANAYTARNAFSSGGGIASWGTIGQIFPSITFQKDAYLKSYTQHEVAEEIKTLMSNGQHIIVNVNGHHWVYIEGVVGDDVYMIDPASDSRLMFEYYNISGGNEYWALKCKNPPSEMEISKFPAEYINESNEKLPIYNSENGTGQPMQYLESGYVVNIGEVAGDFAGIFDSNGNAIGWVEYSALTETEKDVTYTIGDINNDGIIDVYDLSLLNDYIKFRNNLPDGISYLKNCELTAADINNDGLVDNNDILWYLNIICK